MKQSELLAEYGHTCTREQALLDKDVARKEHKAWEVCRNNRKRPGYEKVMNVTIKK